MNRLLRGVALAAAGAVALSLYRQWQQLPDPHRRRHHLDTWENEGGALPEAEVPNAQADALGRRLDS